MDDLISRQAAIDIAYPFDDNERNLIDALEELPSADARENVKGEWLNMERIEDDKAEYITEWQQAQCSVCHKWHTTPYMFFIKKNERHYKFTHFNFCPNCGADMRGGKSE